MHLCRLSLTLIAAATLVPLGVRRADAQAILVQQPVVERFGVSTVVSVPDRGSALLGSVSSSSTFHRGNRPVGFGSNLSREQRRGDLRVHVWVHDFEAMDAALLAGDHKTMPDNRPRSELSGMAAVACDQLLRQHEVGSKPRFHNRSPDHVNFNTSRNRALQRVHEPTVTRRQARP